MIGIATLRPKLISLTRIRLLSVLTSIGPILKIVGKESDCFFLFRVAVIAGLLKGITAGRLFA
jgi:hypothetical protein